MVDFVKARATAKRLIDKNGRLVTFSKETRTASDASKPWKKTTGTAASFTMICSFINYESREIDGDKIKVGDQKMLANAIDNGDNNIVDFNTVTDGDETWRIKKVDSIRPGDIVVMYEVQVRK